MPIPLRACRPRLTASQGGEVKIKINRNGNGNGQAKSTEMLRKWT
ncbi:MAG: hypothetical protein WC617_01915 [Rhodanobacter sp.]